MKHLLTMLLLVLPVLAQSDEVARPAKIDFNRDVRPILAENCWYCHGPDANHRQAELRLDVREDAISASAIVPGEPGSSTLVERVYASDPETRMPPPDSKRILTESQKEILRQWIAEGAEYQKHWAFESPVLAPPPDVPGVEHPIDRFIQFRLREQGLGPSPLASSETLIRRVSLDLTGLPPTLAEIDAFVAAAAIDPEEAYQALVERLLASPHYGERWGRWWLDQARYADSNGYSIDAPRQIWPYRDWVTNALNADMPFDRFTAEQLAGDLLPEATDSTRIATGFHRNTQINQEGGIDKEQFRVDSVFDRVATTGTVWLGLTIGCAQCHDHKFDPITQREYYQLFAFLNNQEEPSIKVYGPGAQSIQEQFREATKKLAAYLDEHEPELAKASQTDDSEAEEAAVADAKKKQAAALKKILAVPPEKRSLADRRTLFAASLLGKDEEFQRLSREFTELDRRMNDVPTTLVLRELAKPRKTTILIKGDFTRPADEVQPGTPALLPPLVGDDQTADRLDLARWLTSRDNPLTARVIVNRVWQQYFGRGIVETENDFGSQGTLPSHPELLDWLAIDFMDHGWQLKELHRRIVSSHAYRQSSADRPELRAKDPHNYLLGRQRRLRLDAEIVRDVALTASGLLSRKIGGPPVFPPIPEGVMGQGQVKHAWNVSAGEDRYRRGYYTFVFRATPPPALNVFDAPDGYSSCTRRIRSNTPLQALTLLNDSTCVEFADALAKIIETEGLESAFRRCTARRPQPDELAVLQSLDTWSAARVLLNLDETITRE